MEGKSRRERERAGGRWIRRTKETSSVVLCKWQVMMNTHPYPSMARPLLPSTFTYPYLSTLIMTTNPAPPLIPLATDDHPISLSSQSPIPTHSPGFVPIRRKSVYPDLRSFPCALVCPIVSSRLSQHETSHSQDIYQRPISHAHSGSQEPTWPVKDSWFHPSIPHAHILSLAHLTFLSPNPSIFTTLISRF